MPSQHATLPLSALIEFENVRKTYLDEVIDALAASLKAKGQLVPVLVKKFDPALKGHAIIDGHQRYRAAIKAGLKELDCMILESVGIETLETQFATLCRSDLSPYEQFVGFQAWMDATKATAKELAEKIGRDPSQVSRILSLGKCIPSIQEAAKEGKLVTDGWYAISKLPPDEQPVLLDLKLNGANREEMARHVKKRTKSETETVKGNGKIKCPLPGGKLVTVVGGATLDEALDALTEALKSVKAAMSKGYNVKTAQAMWADLAAN